MGQADKVNTAWVRWIQSTQLGSGGYSQHSLDQVDTVNTAWVRWIQSTQLGSGGYNQHSLGQVDTVNTAEIRWRESSVSIKMKPLVTLVQERKKER